MRLNKRLLTVLAVTVGSSLIGIGCASKKDSSATRVSSSFKMTGSGSAATVAAHKRPTLWSLLVNMAHALVPSSIQDSTGATVTLSSAWTVIKEIEFKSEETTGAEDSTSEIEFKGPYFVDLLSNAPVVLDTQSITQRSIKRIKMKLEAAQTSLPSDAPAGLANNSIYFAGSINGKNFTFQLDDGSEIQIAGPNSFQPSEGSELLVQVQVANIFKQINLSSITNNEVIDHNNRHSGSSLCPQIDSSASDLYTCFRKGLEAQADFGVDKNGDNSLDSSDEHVK